MKLSILDQSPVRTGDSPRQALLDTLQLARCAESLGYHRFWVSEHHNSTMQAGSAPEVLLSAIGAATNQIRIGSGGIMLPHYSAFKVAETFSLLANLYPGRVDLGVGRAPGADIETARALASDGIPKFERFPALVQELTRLLNNQDLRPRVTPAASKTPPVWVLGSSPASAALAAQLGLPYNFALFINSQMSPEIFDLYRREFRPSEQLDEPHVMLTLNGVCADTEAEARRLAMSRRLLWLQYTRGEEGIKVPSVEEAESYPYTEQENTFLDNKFHQSAIGDPEQVKEKIVQLAKDFGTQEIMMLTITYDRDARLRSYELLAQVFDLEARKGVRDNGGADVNQKQKQAESALL